LALERTNTIRKEGVKEGFTQATVEDLDHKPDGPVEKAVFNHIPSFDYFAKFNRFMEEHHEILQQCTYDLHGSRPDVDFSLCVYDVHKTKTEADAFKKKNADHVIAGITNIDKNRWVLMGSYLQNRERVDFINDKTAILKSMMDKRKEDEPTMRDILKKKVKNAKKKNIAEAGPDDKEFVDYIKKNKPDIAKLGGEHITADKPEKDEFTEEVGDCPEDLVEVNVFDLRDGGKSMKVRKIYNPVEAPADREAEEEKKED